MLGLSDAAWVVLGGITTAFIGGGFTLAGVVVSTIAQRKPAVVEPDSERAKQAEVDLTEMTLDRDRWRAVAETFMPRRREDDHDEAPDEAE